jgi:hypothetical protein
MNEYISIPLQLDYNGQSANTETCWYSRSWLDYLRDPTAIQTSIRLSWGKTYELSRIVVDFCSIRPHQMIFEKSADMGVTWQPLQYFMYGTDCNKYFTSGAATTTVTAAKPESVICTKKYSQGSGEVPFDIEDERYSLYLGADGTNYENLMTAFDNTKLLEFMRFTDLRIRLIEPATDGNLKLGKVQDLIKYNFGISNIDVVGG